MKVISKVNLFPDANEDDYTAAWENANVLLQREPGAHGARLHRMLGGTGVFLMIASWESFEAYQAALDRLSQDGPSIQEELEKPDAYGVTETIALVDDPAWEELPPQGPYLVREAS